MLKLYVAGRKRSFDVDVDSSSILHISNNFLIQAMGRSTASYTGRNVATLQCGHAPS